jgi:hypothetical protein
LSTKMDIDPTTNKGMDSGAARNDDIPAPEDELD